MKIIKKSPDAATGSTTAHKFLLPNEMFAIAYGNFANIYNEAKAYSKQSLDDDAAITGTGHSPFLP